MLNGFPPTCLESSSFQCMIWIWGRCYSKGKKTTLFPVSQLLCCSNAIPSHARRAQGQQGTTASSLCRLQPALPCAGSGSGASWAPPASPTRCRAPTGLAWSSSWKAARQEFAHGCFSVSPWGCAWQVLPVVPPAPRGSGDGISSS